MKQSQKPNLPGISLGTPRGKPGVIILAVVLCLSALPGLACNLFAANTPTPEPAEALRQTLQAMSVPSPTVGMPTIGESPKLTPTLVEILPTATIVSTPAPLPPTQPAAQGPFPTVTPFTGQPSPVGDYYHYSVHWGDTALSLAKRFSVDLDTITAQTGQSLGYLPPDTILQIPNKLGYTTLAYPLLPDSELVHSPSAIHFDLNDFIQQAGGFLSTYTEEVDGEVLTGAQAIQRVADELSVNPRLLLAMLEYRAGWVYGSPANGEAEAYPIGFYVPNRTGLFEEIKITATQLNVGYYGWRQGTQVHVIYPDGQAVHISPDLNAGTAAIMRIFGMFFKNPEDWRRALYGESSFLALYQRMYGDPWVRAATVEPLLPSGLMQPTLELPFEVGVRWKYTGGPHDAWNAGTPRGALDFAPPNEGESICAVSTDWVTAAASGIIVRSAHGAVALDLDGDGYEQTGWVLVHLHLASSDRIAAGAQVTLNDPLGHPSCEGGTATARHLHISRKYNGEWLPAVGPVPFILGGWEAQVSDVSFAGSLVKDAQELPPSMYGESKGYITR